MTQEFPAAQHLVFDTPAGACGLAWRDAGLTAVELPCGARAAVEARLMRRAGSHACAAPPDLVAGWAERIAAYFGGAEDGFEDVDLDMRGLSDFHAGVYRTLRAIGWGETTTYGALAAATGEPGAARAIGVAMAKNRWPLIVPCHRVLAASGKLGGFSAAGGTDTKHAMLRLERSAAMAAAPRLPGLFD